MSEESNQPAIHPCLNCGAKLFSTKVIDRGFVGTLPEGGQPLEEDATGSFFRCPECRSKNRVRWEENQAGGSTGIIFEFEPAS